MPEFIYFVELSRPDFMETATQEELAAFNAHVEFLKRKLDAGELVLVGRTQDESPVGICVFEAEDADKAQGFMDEDPAVAKGVFVGKVRPYHVFLMRGRDEVS